MARCTAGVDRSQMCFRCGQPGHKAGICTGKPADHQTGSMACARPKKKNNASITDMTKKATSSSQPVHPPVAAEHPPRAGRETTDTDINRYRALRLFESQPDSEPSTKIKKQKSKSYSR
ncbi:unnamed protein product [Arctia plantaginis]|uniref:CCHC-type domain-containing protein n=1 Tax=Arctia plantaginis TaxID=874455 RepID=A0A8S1B377_ARCPL|nr:unnamed protein product [Arctia plantaginis]CAB3252433.1 unnamed protein product [Arctia plantaginis]